MKKFLGIILFIPLYLILIFSCNRKTEKKDSKFYTMLVNKDWVLLQGRLPLITDMSFNTTLLSFKTLYFYVDSIKKNWPSIGDSIKKIQCWPDSIPRPEFGYISRVFRFDTSGTITYDLKKTKNIKLIDDYFALDKGSWALKTDTLILDIKGNNYDTAFHYKMQFLVSFSDSNSMKLRLLKPVVVE